MCHTDLYLLSACGQMRLWTLLTPHFSVCRLFAAFTVIFRCATVTAHVSRDSDCHFELVNFHFFNKRVHDCAIFGVHLHFEAQIKLSFCIATQFGVFFFFFLLQPNCFRSRFSHFSYCFDIKFACSSRLLPRICAFLTNKGLLHMQINPPH